MSRSTALESPPPEVLEEACLRMARLWSDDVTDADRRACWQWRQASPDHERAWQQLQAIDERFGMLPRHAARSDLFEVGRGVSRRSLLQWGGVAVLLGGVGAGLSRSPQWQRQLADHSTGVGEMRQITLGDGSVLDLGNDTAIDVDFSNTQRVVHLKRGEVLITTSKLPDDRPLYVTTAEGRSYPLGTRFSVHQHERGTGVSVFEGRVALELRGGSAAVTLESGQRALMQAGTVSLPQPVDPAVPARFQGHLVVERWRVAEVAAELARYRHGVVRCAPEVANLKVSGVFSLRDTDRALRTLADALSLKLVYRTSLWVTIQPHGQDRVNPGQEF